MNVTSVLELPGTRPFIDAPQGVSQALLSEGWARVSGVLQAAEVQRLRVALDAAFAPMKPGLVKAPGLGPTLSDLFQYPEVYPLLFTDRLMAGLKSLVGDGMVLLPEHGAHHEGYGVWHKDTDMFECRGLMWHWDAGYQIYQCAVYLQDNSAEHAGGLTVVPRSHLQRKPQATLADAAQREAWYAFQAQQMLPSKAGDLVLFDTRMDHRATHPTHAGGRLHKLALFFTTARRNDYARLYTQFIAQRPDYGYLKSYRIPDAMQRLALAHGLQWVV